MRGEPGVHNLVYMHPEGDICPSEGVHLRLGIEGKGTYMYCFFPNIHENYQWILFSKIITCLLLNISMMNH